MLTKGQNSQTIDYNREGKIGKFVAMSKHSRIFMLFIVSADAKSFYVSEKHYTKIFKFLKNNG